MFGICVIKFYLEGINVLVVIKIEIENVIFVGWLLNLFVLFFKGNKMINIC